MSNHRLRETYLINASEKCATILRHEITDRIIAECN